MLDINKRIKELRESLNLSQEAFGSAIGLSKSGISNIENGTRNVTEKHIILINNAFNVNENWLRNGQGEMFESISTNILDELAKQYNLNPLAKKIVESFVTLDEKDMNSVLNFIKRISIVNDEIAVAKNEEDDVDKELEAYRLELEAEKKERTLSALEDLEEKSIG